jgi:hypothetical protein
MKTYFYLNRASRKLTYVLEVTHVVFGVVLLGSISPPPHFPSAYIGSGNAR